jgi:hypothetical protein
MTEQELDEVAALLANEIDELKEQVTSIPDLKSRVAALERRIFMAEGEIADLKRRLNGGAR